LQFAICNQETAIAFLSEIGFLAPIFRRSKTRPKPANDREKSLTALGVGVFQKEDKFKIA
jgi:hypothetical protein